MASSGRGTTFHDDGEAPAEQRLGSQGAGLPRALLERLRTPRIDRRTGSGIDNEIKDRAAGPAGRASGARLDRKSDLLGEELAELSGGNPFVLGPRTE